MTTETYETYSQMKKRHRKEVDGFEGLFFAFSNAQLKEGIEKIGLTMADTSKICSIGAGGFMPMDKFKDFVLMKDRQEAERKQLKNDNTELLVALIYELNNHEFCITGDIEPALAALSLKEADIPVEILRKAINDCRQERGL